MNRMSLFKGARPSISRPNISGPKLNLSTKQKIGLGAAGAAAGLGAYKANKEVYKKVTEDEFAEDTILETPALRFVKAAGKSKLGKAASYGARGLAAADLAVLGHSVAGDAKARKLRDREESVQEARHTATQRGIRRVGERVGRHASKGDQAMLVGLSAGGIYYKAKDYHNKKLLKKVTGGRVDRSREN